METPLLNKFCFSKHLTQIPEVRSPFSREDRLDGQGILLCFQFAAAAAQSVPEAHFVLQMCKEGWGLAMISNG